VKHPHFSEKIILEVEHIKSGSMVKDASFTLRQGEVLGFAGLVGAGRSEMMNCLFGLAKVESGKIFLDGNPISIRNVREAIQMGFGMVPEDRNQEGIFPVQSIRYNTTIEVMDQFLGSGVYNAEKEYELAKKYLDDVLATRYSSLEQSIASLSGGNMQKVIFSRWLLSTKKILILDEPTRGIDVKTKTEIYRLIDNLTEQGLTIMLVSSELPELINMSDRIVVMSHGYTTGVLAREEFSQEKIMTYATMEM
jgi:ribose transport system ATP-binding protein